MLRHPRPTLPLALLLFLVAAGPTHAGWFELALSSDALHAEGGGHLGHDPEGRVALGGRALFEDEHDTRLGGFVVRLDAAPSAREGLDFGAGVDLLAGKGAKRDVGAAVVGVQAAWAPEAWRGAFVGARVGYAPDFLSWSDTKRLFEWSVRGGYHVTRRIALFAEYQKLEARFDDLGSRSLASGVRLGFGGRF